MILNYNVQPRVDKNHRLEQYYIPLLDILTWNSFSRCRHCISSAFSLLFKLFWTAVNKYKNRMQDMRRRTAEKEWKKLWDEDFEKIRLSKSKKRTEFVRTIIFFCFFVISV